MSGSRETERTAQAFAERFSKRAGEDLESIVYSPFPFAEGQLLVACRPHVPFLRELIVAACRSDPPRILTHWLRSSELRHLSMPSAIGRYMGWSYWLRHKGKVLWGSDVRNLIPLPENPRRMLEAVLSLCLTWDRNHLFLGLLAKGKHAELLQALAALARSLMATALLLHGEWEVDEETVFGRFAGAFGADGAEELCSLMSEIFHAQQGLKPGEADPEDLCRRAREGVWLVERLIRLLRRQVE